MNIRELEYFVAVAELRHFGKAAQKVHVSQPTLSMQLKKLEESLGAPLFERTSREVLITAFGEEVLEHAREVLFQRDTILEFGRRAANPLAGDLHIGIFPTLAPYLLPPLTPILKRQLPALKLFFHEERTEFLLEKLLTGKIDVAFMALPIDSDKLETIFLFEEEFQLAVPKDHELAKFKTISSDKLEEQDLLLLEDGHCFRDQALAVCAHAKAQVNTDFSATSIETLLSMIAAGSGITLVPQMAARGKRKQVSFLSFRGKTPKRAIALVYRSSSHRKDLFRKIEDCLKGKFPL